MSASKTKTDELDLYGYSLKLWKCLEAFHAKSIRQVFSYLPHKSPNQKWDGRSTTAWKKALLAADIRDATFHDLRHDFVTRAMRNGNASHVVMKQVGHKTDSMLRRYQLIDERDLLELHLDQPRSYSKKDFA